MPFRHSQKRPTPPSRRLALEPIEPRALCAAVPVHVPIPAEDFIGSTLKPDGTVEVYGDDSQWSIASDGRLLSKIPLDATAQASHHSVYAVSPDGTWFAGAKNTEVPGEPDPIVVWKRGSAEYIPVGVPLGTVRRTAFVMDVSNSGDVIYKSYFENAPPIFWNRSTGLQSLQSLYAIEGNPSPAADKFHLSAISADGRTIVGSSGDFSSLGLRATIWVDGVAQELSRGDYLQSNATSVSQDGRVVGGFVVNGEGHQLPTVWVDGILHKLTPSTIARGYSPEFEIVNGLGGDPTQWAALGINWIARSDGVMHSLSSYLPENFGLSVRSESYPNPPLRLLAGDDALYVISKSFLYANIDSLDPVYPPGNFVTHVFVLPLEYSHNATASFDLSGDSHVSPQDALLVINALNENPSATLLDRPDLRLAIPKIDVNGDGELTAADALQIINFLNDPPAAGEGESSSSADPLDSTLAADALFADLVMPRKAKSK